MSSGRPVCIADLERYAIQHLDKNTLNYYQTGANDDITLTDNVNANSRYKIRPRVLRDVSNTDFSTTILGQRIEMPICIAPTSMHKLAHEHGEVATLQAATELGICYTLAFGSSCSLEEMDFGRGVKWPQLYFTGHRSMTEELVRKAERFGYQALVVTVDVPVLGYRTKLLEEPFKSPEHIRVLVVAEDAVLAVHCGVSGIIVSNHGGRQLDSTPATIDVLPEVVTAVDGRCEVYVDGGVRSGIDVIKAIALGARAVFVGRPILWGLAYNGKDGVVHVLNILKEEFKTAMQIAGARTIDDVKRDVLVVNQSSYTGATPRSSKKSKL